MQERPQEQAVDVEETAQHVGDKPRLGERSVRDDAVVVALQVRPDVAENLHSEADGERSIRKKT